MKNTGLRFIFSVAGLPIETFSVAGFSLKEHYSDLFSLELELASSNSAIDFGAVLDSNVTLTVLQDADVQRVINGIVVSMEQGDTGFHRTRYALSIRPALWRVGLTLNSRIFQQQDLRTIIETLLKEHNIFDFAFSFRDKHAVREFCVQYQEDDLAFIHRMCAEEGIFYFFEHENHKHTIVFSDDVSVLNEGPTLPYNPTPDREWCITSLKRRETIRPSNVLLKDYTFKNPMWAAEYSEYARDVRHQHQSYQHYSYPGRFKDESGKDFSRWRIEALRNDAHLGHGKSNCAALLPGSDFTLKDHPRDEMNTRWQVVAAYHHGRQPQALEEEAGEQGTVLNCEFSFIPRRQTWRPFIPDKPTIDGAQIAIVTGPPGEEIYCDEYGRVRVHFLWDRSGITDEKSSCWIRVSQPWAGQKWGNLSIPRIGHEVIVEFLNGDPDQPVIIGRTYHANNLPVGKLPDNKTQMSIRSKTHKGTGFNELRFDDANGNEEVFIHAQKDMNTKVLNDRTTTVLNDHSESVDGHQNIKIKKNQTEEIGGNQKLTVSKNQTETVAIAKAESIGAAKALTIGAGYQVSVGAMMNTTVALSQTEEIGVHKYVMVGQSCTLIAGDIIELKCGKSSLRMDKTGKVTIKGAEFLFDASGPVQINGQDIDLN